MKENDVAFLGTLLNTDPANVEKAVEDGTLGEQIASLGLMNKNDVETLKTNLSREVRAAHLAELEEAAKKGELPQEIYKPINGAVLEKLEKKLSKEYGVNEYSGIEDLVSKAITNSANPDDTKAQELLDKITALQEANTKLVSDKEETEKRLTQEKNDWILNREKQDVINQVPFDFSDVDENELESTTQQRKEILLNVFDARFKLGFKEDKVTVFKKDDNTPILNEATYEPIPLLDVLNKTAATLGQKLKSPETGGQGGQSSKNKGSRFASTEEFMAYCDKNGIQPTSSKGLALLKESGLKLY